MRSQCTIQPSLSCFFFPLNSGGECTNTQKAAVDFWTYYRFSSSHIMHIISDNIRCHFLRWINIYTWINNCRERNGVWDELSENYSTDKLCCTFLSHPEILSRNKQSIQHSPLLQLVLALSDLTHLKKAQIGLMHFTLVIIAYKTWYMCCQPYGKWTLVYL